MLCLKCGKKEMLQYSELCDDCENKSLGIALWIVLIGLILTTFFSTIELIEVIKYLIFSIKNHQLPLLLYSCYWLIAKLAVIGLAAYSLYLFIKRRRKMPLVYMIMLVSFALFTCIDFLIVYFLTDGNIPNLVVFSLIRTLIISIIWGCYMLMSDKVKLHFVN